MFYTVIKLSGHLTNTRAERRAVLCSDKTGFFSQSEHALDCIYVLYSDKTGFFSQSERALDLSTLTKKMATVHCPQCIAIMNLKMYFITGNFVIFQKNSEHLMTRKKENYVTAKSRKLS
jgi:hypothetical protein